MRNQLQLGSTVSFTSGQTGHVTGFFTVRPEAKKSINGDHCIPAEHAGWFAETSYAVARADTGFASVITENGPIYWRLDCLTIIASDDDMIIFDDDEW